MVAESTERWRNRVEKYRDECPEGTGDVFEALLADDFTPRVACASLHYIHRLLNDDKSTQAEIADEFECSHASIRQCYHHALDEYPIKFNFTTEQVGNDVDDVYMAWTPSP